MFGGSTTMPYLRNGGLCNPRWLNHIERQHPARNQREVYHEQRPVAHHRGDGRRRPAISDLVPILGRCACIVADYQESDDRIQATPDYFLVEEARASHNPYYLKDFLRQAAQMHINISTLPSHDSWKGTLLGETQRTTG